MISISILKRHESEANCSKPTKNLTYYASFTWSILAWYLTSNNIWEAGDHSHNATTGEVDQPPQWISGTALLYNIVSTTSERSIKLQGKMRLGEFFVVNVLIQFFRSFLAWILSIRLLSKHTRPIMLTSLPTEVFHLIAEQVRSVIALICTMRLTLGTALMERYDLIEFIVARMSFQVWTIDLPYYCSLSSEQTSLPNVIAYFEKTGKSKGQPQYLRTAPDRAEHENQRRIQSEPCRSVEKHSKSGNVLLEQCFPRTQWGLELYP